VTIPFTSENGQLRRSQVNLTGSVGTLPPAVWGNAVDDPAAHGLLFYGGTNGCFNPEGGLALTWVFANNAWTNITQQQSLTPANPMGVTTMGYDPTRDGVVMFSGLTLNCVETNSTYLFTGGQWTNLTSSVGAPPPPRWNSRLVNVPGVGDVIFSGNENPVGGANSFGADTWVLGPGSASGGSGGVGGGGGRGGGGGGDGGGGSASVSAGVGSTDWAGAAVWVILVAGVAIAVLNLLRWPPRWFGPSKGR
jgi:hypothetical protein